MKKAIVIFTIMTLMLSSMPVFAGTHGKNGKVTAKSIGAGALSLLVWPGIGQAINDQKYEKNITHAILGLTVVFRFWSCYDAVVDRDGGVWKDRI